MQLKRIHYPFFKCVWVSVCVLSSTIHLRGSWICAEESNWKYELLTETNWFRLINFQYIDVHVFKKKLSLYEIYVHYTLIRAYIRDTPNYSMLQAIIYKEQFHGYLTGIVGELFGVSLLYTPTYSVIYHHQTKTSDF